MMNAPLSFDSRMVYRKRYILLSGMLALLAFAQPSVADTLTTPTYVITITSHCEEGDMDCDNVSYQGVNRNNKKSIRLKGHDVVHYCPDDQGDGPGKTPCHHMGYEFANGKTKYFVSDEGSVEITQGVKQILYEKGTWE